MRTLFLTLLACTTLFADEASKNAKIEQFLKIIKADSIQEQVFAELTQQIDNVAQATAQRSGIAAPLRASAVTDLKDKMTVTMKQYMSWDKMKPGMIKAYSDAYTEADLDALLAFFKSPIGQTYVAKSPIIAARSKEVAEGQMKAMTASIQATTKDWLDQHQNPAAK